MRLVSIIRAAPNPRDVADSDIASAYKRWYYGVRLERMTVEEMRMEI